jgi:hypothetical protein
MKGLGRHGENRGSDMSGFWLLLCLHAALWAVAWLFDRWVNRAAPQQALTLLD